MQTELTEDSSGQPQDPGLIFEPVASYSSEKSSETVDLKVGDVIRVEVRDSKKSQSYFSRPIKLESDSDTLWDKIKSIF